MAPAITYQREDKHQLSIYNIFFFSKVARHLHFIQSLLVTGNQPTKYSLCEWNFLFNTGKYFIWLGVACGNNCLSDRFEKLIFLYTHSSHLALAIFLPHFLFWSQTLVGDGGDIVDPVRVQHFADSCSLHLGQLCDFMLNTINCK